MRDLVKYRNRELHWVWYGLDYRGIVVQFSAGARDVLL